MSFTDIPAKARPRALSRFSLSNGNQKSGLVGLLLTRLRAPKTATKLTAANDQTSSVSTDCEATAFCPRWPGCDCPDGTVALDCPLRE